MMRRAHRLAALLAAATTLFGSAAVASADPQPSAPKPSDPQPKPASSQSCEALAEPANDLDDLKNKLFGLAGNASNATKNGLDFGSLIGLYSQSQEILRSLREESGKLRTAADDVHEQDLHDSTIALADTFDEGANLADQATNPTTAKDGLSTKVTDLTTRASTSLQRFGESYQKHCGVDLGLGNLTALAKSLGGLSQGQKAPSQPNQGQSAPAPVSPSQQAPAPLQAPAPAVPNDESASAPAPASNRSLLAPAPIK